MKLKMAKEIKTGYAKKQEEYQNHKISTREFNFQKINFE